MCFRENVPKHQWEDSTFSSKLKTKIKIATANIDVFCKVLEGDNILSQYYQKEAKFTFSAKQTWEQSYTLFKFLCLICFCIFIHKILTSISAIQSEIVLYVHVRKYNEKSDKFG